MIIDNVQLCKCTRQVHSYGGGGTLLKHNRCPQNNEEYEKKKRNSTYLPAWPKNPTFHMQHFKLQTL